MYVLAQRILGTEQARRLFDGISREQGTSAGLPEPTDAMILQLERELAGTVGAASSHAMVRRIAGRGSISMTELFNIADESQRFMATSQQFSKKSAELTATTKQLTEANERLQQLDTQKDDFLSQVSHELRTPMTSIRSFSEILLSHEDISEAEKRRFVSIIHEESQRLTRLLNEILDMSRLESGSVEMPLESVNATLIVQAAIDTLDGVIRERNVNIHTVSEEAPARVWANADRMQQILINLLSNAIKYNNAERPVIEVSSRTSTGYLLIDIADNGGGVKREEAGIIFEKFTRGRRSKLDQGAGLGLSISRAIARTMGGDLTLEFSDDGTSYFRLRIPLEA